MNGAIWSLVTILGPVLLIAVLVWAYLRNRNAGPRNLERAERGAAELREDLQRDPEYRED